MVLGSEVITTDEKPLIFIDKIVKINVITYTKKDK